MHGGLKKYQQNPSSHPMRDLNPLSANPTKWSNTLKQFVGKFPTNCVSVFDHFVKLALKGLKKLHPRCLTGFKMHLWVAQADSVKLDTEKHSCMQIYERNLKAKGVIRTQSNIFL